MQQTLLLIGIACVVGAVAGGGSKLAGVELPLISSPLRQILLAFIGITLIGSVERVRLALRALSKNQRLVLAVVAILGMFVGVTGTLITQKVLDLPAHRAAMSQGPLPGSPAPSPGAAGPSGTPSPINSSGPPSPASSVPSSSAPPAPPGPSKYVADLVPVEGNTSYLDRDTWTMNLTPHEHSLGMAGFCDDKEVGFNLSRSFRTFRAMVGVTDDSLSGKKLDFVVLADGTERVRREVELGKPVLVDADVSGVLRLTLRIEQGVMGCFTQGVAVWGTPQIYQ